MKKPAKPKRKKKNSSAPSKSDALGRMPRLRRWRKWLARLSAVVLAPVLFLLVVELGLWLFGYGYDASYFIEADDPGTYLSNPRFSERFFGPDLARSPTETVISARKPEQTYRVFVFGGSAARGTPDPAFSFSRILEAMLRDRYPQTRFEVINTAMVAINSHVVLPIVKDCRGFDGDLFIVYLGNNEVVGPYGAGSVFESPSTSIRLTRAGIFARSTRLGQLMGNTMRALAGEDAEARKEWGGMTMFLDHRVTADDPRMNIVYDHFAANLRDVCVEARDAGIPVIVSTVLTNLKDCPPFHSVHRPGLSDDELARWKKAFQKADALRKSGEYEAALGEYGAAEEIDEQFAELHFRMGQCRLAMQQFDPARRRFVRARDLDTLRFRADTRINATIRRLAGNRRSRGVYLVDPEAVYRARGQTPDRIPGWELLHEHVHLNFAGNYLVAATIFEELVPLLPQAIRRNAKDDVPPPSAARCQELTLYTKFNQFYAATKTAEITWDPPFPKRLGQRSLAEAKRLEAELTPEVLGQIAEKYDQALQQRPDDLPWRSVFALVQSNRGDYASAAEQYRALLERYPESVSWQHQLARALAGQGRTDEAIAQFRAVLKRAPHHVETLTGLAAALVKQDRFDEAVAAYEKALSIRPEHAKTHVELGRVLLRRDRPKEAEKHFQTALEADPAGPRFHFFLGLALAGQQQPERAAEQFRQEIALHPGDPLPHLELGQVLLAGGGLEQAEQAMAHYRRALNLQPQLLPALNNLAWLYATHPQDHLRNGNRAVLLAERAVGLLERPEPALLDTQAAAYAEAGRFDPAVETARRAIALARQAGATSLADAIQGRLDLYLAGKPFRESSP